MGRTGRPHRKTMRIPPGRRRARVRVSAGAVFGLALVWTLTSGRFLLLLLCAAALHEGGHLLAARLCGVRPCGFSVTLCGAELRLEGQLSPGRALIIALAGPAVSLAAAFLSAALLPETWESALFTGQNLAAALFNLLPVEPLDGGRVLVSLLRLLGLEENAVQSLNRAGTVSLLLGLLPGGLLALRGNGSLLLMLLWLLSGRLPLLMETPRAWPRRTERKN